MSFWSLLLAAGALSVERICYVWVWNSPQSFLMFCSHPLIARCGEPVDVLRNLFICFKILQLSVFMGWCYIHGHGLIRHAGEEAIWMGVGGVLIAIGQLLNAAVFVRLGKVGVFYGNRLGITLFGAKDCPSPCSGIPSTLEPYCRSGGFSSVCDSPTMTGS